MALTASGVVLKIKTLCPLVLFVHALVLLGLTVVAYVDFFFFKKKEGCTGPKETYDKTIVELQQ
jgi:hypothetical protein